MLDESVLRGAKLCVVGNINRDFKTSPFSPAEYLFEDGETSIDGISETVGGGGANSAAISAALGADSSFIGQVGVDELGRRLEDSLTRAGVRCHLHRAANLATGTTFNLVFNTGRRHFLSSHPNNVALAFDTLDLSAFHSSEHLLRADIWFSESMLFGGNEKLFRAARALGVAISVDLNWDPAWRFASREAIEQRKEAVRRLLPLVDLAHGNVRELNEFTGEGELRVSLAKLLEWGAKAVVVHMGGQGAGYFSGSEFIVEPPMAVANPVHTTGTGDVLSACLMLLHRRVEVPIADKLRLANRIVAEFMEGKRQLIPKL
jgi:sugar/nucleoside kinase (ribokinase family)